MVLHTDYPYSLIKNGIINSYPSLQKHIKTDVVIMGAGISGALAAWHLAKNNIDCVVVDKRHAGMGSTAASTSLIQYEIDTPLHELVKKTGYKNAVACYKLCLQAVSDLKQLCHDLGIAELFQDKCSFQYASFKKDINSLKEEYRIRKENGFAVELIEEGNIKKLFGFEAAAGLLNQDAGQLDAYVLTHRILEKIHDNSCRIYDQTNINTITHKKNGIELTTATNHIITAKKLIIAGGYESQQYLSKKVEDLKCTYVICSEVLTEKNPWFQNCLIWETATPYLYLRTTNDHRIIAGGKDTKYFSGNKQKQLLKIKSRSLVKNFNRLFPHIEFKIDFKWSGAFGNTSDGLPYIGSVREHPHTYFALGYGGNGITFSLMAAQMIADDIISKKSPHFKLFSFDRLS